VAVNLIDTTTAAKEKACSRNAVLAAIRRGDIDGEQTGRYFVVKANTKYQEWAPNPTRQQIGRESQMAKVRDDFWMRGKMAPNGTDVRIEAARTRAGQWVVHVKKDRATELWGKAYKDEDLPDATDGDAVIEHAWEECCKHPAMEWNTESR
jgi:hypothetical protein